MADPDLTLLRDLLRNLRDDCGHHDAPETREEAEAGLAALDRLAARIRTPHPTALAIVLALDYIDGAAAAGEGGMSTGCELHATCRALIMHTEATPLSRTSPLCETVHSLRVALWMAAQVHGATLVGAKWESVGEPWEDREDSASRLRLLCHLLAGTVQTAAAVGDLRLLSAEGP